MGTPMYTLTSTQERDLNKADKAAVFDIFQNQNDCKNGQWLGATNSYVQDIITKVKDDLAANTLNHSDLGAYISISAPLHCIDGWKYLSRSVSSLIHGDYHTSRHLAYYAELRAAISILASEGIAILKNKHFVVDQQHTCVRITGGVGTHEFVWPVLKHWSKQPSATKLIGSIVMPYGIKLEDWHKQFASTATFQAIAESWLVSWGLDLQQLDDDHETRNHVSYRPSKISPESAPAPTQVSSFVREFWTTYSPSGLSRFDELDRYLLNKSLQSANTAHAIPGVSYQERVRNAVSSLFFDAPDEVKETYSNFLSVDQECLILKHAGSNGPVSEQVYQMLSRASLLLRIATGANAELLRYSGYSWSDFEFWWKELGINLGLWEPDTELEPADLWEDILNCVTEMDTWEKNVNSPSTFNLLMTNNNARNLWMLSGTERIALWGLHR